MSETESICEAPVVDSGLDSVLRAVGSVFPGVAFTLTYRVECDGKAVETVVEVPTHQVPRGVVNISVDDQGRPFVLAAQVPEIMANHKRRRV